MSSSYKIINDMSNFLNFLPALLLGEKENFKDFYVT